MKFKNTVAADTIRANSINAVSMPTENIQNDSVMTEAGQIETKAHTITAPTNDFKAHGNNTRVAIDYGDDHIQTTENAYAFDNATIGYLGRFSFVQVRPTAFHEKGAQGETTVRKSECSLYSNDLSLSQPGPHGCITHFTCNAFGRVIREDRPDSTWAKTKYVYDDSQSVTNPRNGLSARSKYRATTTGSVAPPSTTWYDRAGRAIRACTESFDGRTIYQDTGYNAFGQVDCVAENYYAADGPTHWTKTTFDTLGRVDVVEAPDGTKAKTIYNGR